MGMKERIFELTTRKWYPVAAGAASVAIGCIAGTVADIVYRKVAVDPEDEYKEMLEDFRYAEKIELKNRILSKADNIESEDTDGDVKPLISTNFEKKPLVDYTKFSKSNSEKEASDDKTENEDVVPTPATVISEEEFVRASGNLDGYTTAIGTWFAQERILAGWNDKLEVKDPEESIGMEAVRLLDDGQASVHVRNTALKVLFEIVLSEFSYEDALEESAS